MGKTSCGNKMYWIYVIKKTVHWLTDSLTHWLQLHDNTNVVGFSSCQGAELESRFFFPNEHSCVSHFKTLAWESPGWMKTALSPLSTIFRKVQWTFYGPYQISPLLRL
jgi:hypothetical protein